MSYFVYILECEDNTLYTGIAKDVEKRFSLHKTGKGAQYTKSHPPKKIIYRKEYLTKNEALKEEYRIKQLTRKDKLRIVVLQSKQFMN